MESMMRHVIALAAILPAFALAASAAFAAETGKYCLKGSGTTMNCTYETMASCVIRRDRHGDLRRQPRQHDWLGCEGSTSSSIPSKKY